MVSVSKLVDQLQRAPGKPRKAYSIMDLDRQRARLESLGYTIESTGYHFKVTHGGQLVAQWQTRKPIGRYSAASRAQDSLNRACKEAWTHNKRMKK